MKPEKRGKFITCKNCGYEFKFLSDKDRALWEDSNFKCQACGELYCNKPEMERRLFGLQDLYLKNKSERNLNNLIKLLLQYCSGFIKKFYSSYIEDDDDLIYYSHIAVTFVVEDYYLIKDNRVQFSFAGVLIGKIKQAIFNKNEIPTDAISLNWEFKDGHESGNSVFVDKRCVIDEIDNQKNKEDVFKFISNLIDEVSSQCSPYEDYLRILALRHYLVEKEDKSNKLFQEEIKNKDNKTVKHKTYGRVGKYKYLKTLDIIKKELIKIV